MTLNRKCAPCDDLGPVLTPQALLDRQTWIKDALHAKAVERITLSSGIHVFGASNPSTASTTLSLVNPKII